MSDIHQRRHDRVALLARYGSVEAVLAPCKRERLIIAAVEPWRTKMPPPDERWTDKLDGWSGDTHSAPQWSAVAAIRSAYTTPTSFSEALEEARYWDKRNEDIDVALDDEHTGHGVDRLDFAVSIRAAEVRKLIEHILPATSAADVLLRFKIFRQAGCADDAIGDALQRDLAALADQEAPAAPAAHARDGLAAAIREALAADQARSDRDIARACGCSATTVGAVRRKMGIDQTVRAVHRGHQKYEMRTFRPSGPVWP